MVVSNSSLSGLSDGLASANTAVSWGTTSANTAVGRRAASAHATIGWGTTATNATIGRAELCGRKGEFEFHGIPLVYIDGSHDTTPQASKQPSEFA
jgi:hypothetical protein